MIRELYDGYEITVTAIPSAENGWLAKVSIRSRPPAGKTDVTFTSGACFDSANEAESAGMKVAKQWLRDNLQFG